MNKLNFDTDYTLENDVVRLEPLKTEDLDKLLEFALNEPTLWEYSLTPAHGEENMKNYINAAIENRKAGTGYPFIVFDKRKNKYAGSTRFYDFNEIHNTTQLGYTWYGKEFQGTGLNKQCKYLMLNFAFENIGLERVEFRADNKNKRSIQAMKSIGCTVEGVLRSNCVSETGRRDSIVLSILKKEWFNHVKSTLQQKCIKENEQFNAI